MAVTVLSSLFWSAMLSWIPEARAITAGEQGVAFIDNEEDNELLLLELSLLGLQLEASVFEVIISIVDFLEGRLNGKAKTIEANAKMSVWGVKKCMSNAGIE